MRRMNVGGHVREKRVLHVISGLGDGGAEAVLFRLVSCSGATRHHVVSLTDFGKYGPLLQNLGAKVDALSMPRGRITLSGISKLWRIFRAVDRGTPIQTWMYHADLIGGIVALLARQKNIFWGIHHTSLSLNNNRMTTIIAAYFCSFASYIIPKKIVCCAEAAKIVHARFGYDSSKLMVIPNGYDLSVFSHDERLGEVERERLRVPIGVPVIGFVARIDPIKDHSNLIAAISILRQEGVKFTCLLVGAGASDSNYSLMSKIADEKVQDHVRLLGPQENIPKIMNALDIHVLSSKAEGFPNVIAEAMACGTPCVSTDVGDASEIIGSTGIVIPPEDHIALARAIKTLIGEIGTSGWDIRKSAARARIAERYGMDRMLAAYQAVWRVT